METKEERIARRRKEREDKMKATTGYKVYAAVFTVMYPFSAVFTALFAVLVSVTSRISNAIVWVLSGGKSR